MSGFARILRAATHWGTRSATSEVRPGTPIRPRFDGYFRSNRQRREEWHAGVHMVDDYFEYLKLYEDGRWLRASRPNADFDFVTYLSGTDEQTFRDGSVGVHPRGVDSDDAHQSGRYRFLDDGSIELHLRAFLGIMHERRWTLRVTSPDRLVSERGAEYAFQP